MKKIMLTRGQEAIVDDDDFDWLMQWKWYAHWAKNTRSYYAVRCEGVHGDRKKKPLIAMHRFILGVGSGDSLQADHIDHNTLNNQRSNLRVVTNSQNQFNRSAVKGYSFDASSGKFKVRIQVNAKEKTIGRFSTAHEARLAYLAAKQIYHAIPSL